VFMLIDGVAFLGLRGLGDGEEERKIDTLRLRVVRQVAEQIRQDKLVQSKWGC